MSTVRFGPAGNSDSFTAMGYRKNLQIPEYVEKMGLSAYEYQCGRGVKISETAAAELGSAAAAKQIQLSVHAPYYISMSSVEEEKRRNSVNYVLQAAQAVHAMGGNRIVVHTGSCSKISREEALMLAADTMKNCIAALDEHGLHDIHICPETMGKLNQLGTLEEVLALCKLDERLLPCLDFGHLNARSYGGLNSAHAFEQVLDEVENAIGVSRAGMFHAHFSKIEYTNPGGEKRHLTFTDTQFGPDFEPLAELIARRNYSSTIICESAGTQAEDAAAMKRMYLQALYGTDNMTLTGDVIFEEQNRENS